MLGRAFYGLVPSQGRGLRPANHLQETKPDVECGLRLSRRQAFGYQAIGFFGALCLGIDPRIQGAEIPALAVLDCSRSVGVENVSLVKNRSRNLFHRFEVHALTSSRVSVSSARVMACSQVGIPWRTLYS